MLDQPIPSVCHHELHKSVCELRPTAYLPKLTLKTTEISGYGAKKKNFGIRLTKFHVLALSLIEKDGPGEVTSSL